MTVENCYIDSSALRQLYVHDANSAAMAVRRLKHPGAVVLTRFGRTELMNSMASAVFRRDIAEVVFQTFGRLLEEDMADRRLHLVDVSWRTVLDQAAELSRKHTPVLGTRSLGVLHVASALELKVRQFVTYDARQAKLAAACGLKIIRP